MMAVDAVFLGTIVDPEVEELPQVYQELEQQIVETVDWYVNGGDEDEAYQRLASLKLQDDLGNIWTMGASTLTWKVRRQGSRKWESGHPALPPMPGS